MVSRSLCKARVDSQTGPHRQWLMQILLQPKETVTGISSSLKGEASQMISMKVERMVTDSFAAIVCPNLMTLR